MLSRRSKGWIGIDFGTRAIKLAQVERVDAQYRLSFARILQRGPDGEDDPPATALAWWSEACQRGLLRSGFSGRRAACVLSASETDLRAMNIPAGSEAERRAMIAGELATVYGGQKETRAFDFWETREPEAASPSGLESVNVVSVVEDDAAAVAELLSRAGLYCERLDALPLTLAGAVQLVSPPSPGTVVAALDWGLTSATFCIVCDGLPVFTRQLRDCGYSAMLGAVAEALALSVDDAGQLLSAHGLCDPTPCDGVTEEVQEILAEISSAPLSAMVSQLKKTLAYPELYRSQLLPEKIWLFGGGATVRNASALLSQRIGLPVQAWSLAQIGDGAALSQPPTELLGPAIALSALAWQS